MRSEWSAKKRTPKWLIVLTLLVVTLLGVVLILRSCTGNWGQNSQTSATSGGTQSEEKHLLLLRGQEILWDRKPLSLKDLELTVKKLEGTNRVLLVLEDPVNIYREEIVKILDKYRCPYETEISSGAVSPTRG